MYHEITYKEAARRRRRRIIALIVAVVAVVVIVFSSNVLMAGMREQSVLSVRNSVLEAAKQCCAIEGSYPSSLQHLEEQYGLVVNHADYVISYEWLGDNVLPSVVVTPR